MPLCTTEFLKMYVLKIKKLNKVGPSAVAMHGYGMVFERIKRVLLLRHILKKGSFYEKV